MSSRQSSGPVDPPFRALSGRLKFMVRRHKFNKDSSLPAVKSARQNLVWGSRVLVFQGWDRIWGSGFGVWGVGFSGLGL